MANKFFQKSMMSHKPHPAFLSSLALLALSVLSACDSNFALYDVSIVNELRFDINPQGEFEDDLLPPAQQLVGVETKDGRQIVYLGEEIWLVEEDPVETGTETEAFRASKETKTTRGEGLCEQTVQRTLTFTVTGDPFSGTEAFSGTLDENERLEGAESCGETPRGTRARFQLDGPRTFSL